MRRGELADGVRMASRVGDRARRSRPRATPPRAAARGGRHPRRAGARRDRSRRGGRRARLPFPPPWPRRARCPPHARSRRAPARPTDTWRARRRRRPSTRAPSWPGRSVRPRAPSPSTASASVRSCQKTANSSPPSRNAAPASRRHPPTSARIRSPTGWPCWSLIDLNSSTSKRQSVSERPGLVRLVEQSLELLLEVSMVAETAERIGQRQLHRLERAEHRALVERDREERADQRRREHRRALPEHAEHDRDRRHRRERDDRRLHRLRDDSAESLPPTRC